jgi:hypothetical protein
MPVAVAGHRVDVAELDVLVDGLADRGQCAEQPGPPREARSPVAGVARRAPGLLS